MWEVQGRKLQVQGRKLQLQGRKLQLWLALRLRLRDRNGEVIGKGIIRKPSRIEPITSAGVRDREKDTAGAGP